MRRARRPPHATRVMTTTALVQGRPMSEYLGVVAALGADSVIGIDLDLQSMGPHGALLMVSASGGAVRFGSEPAAMSVRRV